MLSRVANYLNEKHDSNYIVYNLFRYKQLEHASSLFHYISEYTFPQATLVEIISDSNQLKFMTAPPTLRNLFIVIIEMASWLNQNGPDKNVIMMH